MANKLTEVRNALAEHLRVRLELKLGFGRVPPTIQASSVFVIPQPGSDYVGFEEAGTFCRPIVALSAIAVVSAVNNSTATELLDAVIEKAYDLGDIDPTLGGRISGLALRAVGEPGLLDSQGGQLLAAELRLFPFYIV